MIQILLLVLVTVLLANELRSWRVIRKLLHELEKRESER